MKRIWKHMAMIVLSLCAVMNVSARLQSASQAIPQTSARTQAVNKTLRFRNGVFKIVQFSDIHYQYGNPLSDQAEQNIREVVAAEKPDLVMVSGDIIYKAPGSTCLARVLSIFESLGVPYCMIFGNHDGEQQTPLTTLYDMMQKGAHSVMPPRQGSNFDYVLPILGSTGTKPAALVYGIQAYSYSKMKGVGGYQWFTWRQLSWYRDQAAKYKTANGGKVLPAIAFMHYPLPEYRAAVLAMESPLYSIREETSHVPSLNSGMFAQMKEAGDVMGVFCGHDHDNDYSVMYYGVLLGYCRFSGGNTEYNHLRNGARVIVLKEGKREFDTWIRERGGTVYPATHYPSDYVKDNWKLRKGTR